MPLAAPRNHLAAGDVQDLLASALASLTLRNEAAFAYHSRACVVFCAGGQEMSAELIAIISVGATLLVGLGGLVLVLQVRTDKKLDTLETELQSVDRRLARLEGLVEGWSRFRPVAAPAPGPVPASGD